MTPNTVLTDCLNGTLITYNGDEFVLQNDMGNYAMQYGALGDYYVPIGMKEHGGFLYIVAYNPIDNKVKVGTFPSQKTIFTPSDNNIDSDSLESIKLTGNTIYHKYSDIDLQALTIYSKDQNLYLNPGDKYLLGISDGEESAENSWQHLSTYVLTNDNKLYDISNIVDIRFKSDITHIEDFTPIKWEIPGWLCSKFEVNIPEEFIVYFDSYKLDTSKNENGNYTITPSGNLKLKTVWNNSIYKNIIKKYLIGEGKLVYFFSKISITNINKNSIDTSISSGDIIVKPLTNNILSYNDLQTIIHCTVDANTSNSSDSLKISEYNYVCPGLITDDNKYIILDQFETSIVPEIFEINPNNITIGDDYFKYYTDQNSFTLYFNYNSYPGTTIKYSIFRYRDPRYNNDDCDYKIVSLPDSDNGVVELTDLNYNGNNIIDIPFSSQIGKDSFDKEDLYIIEFKVYFGTELLTNKSYPLYVSEITNYFFNIYDSFVTVEDFPKVWSEKITDIVSVEINPSIENSTRSPFIKIKPVGDTEYKSVPMDSSEDKNPQEDIKNNLRKYFGDPFVDVESTELITGITSYRVGQNIVLKKQNIDSVKLTLPTAQDGKTIGRLWRYASLDSISKEQCYAIDSLGKSHKLEVINESISSNEEYVPLSGTIINLPCYDEYNITVGSNSVPKQEPDTYKCLNDYNAHNIFKEQQYNGSIIAPPQFDADSGIICIRSYIHLCVVNKNSFYLELYGNTMSSSKDMYATFDTDNNLYISSDETTIKSLRRQINIGGNISEWSKYKITYDSLDGYNENILYFPDNKKWNNSRVQIEQHNMTSGDGWVDDLGKIVTSGSHYPQIVMMERRGQTSKPFRIGHWGTVDINATWYCGIFIPTTSNHRPIMLFPMGLVDGGLESFPGRSKKSFEVSVAAWCAMMYYLRYAETVKTIVYNYTSLSLSLNAFKEFTLRSINLNGKIVWNYFKRDEIPDKKNSTLDNIIESIESNISGEAGIINYRIPVSINIYFEDDTNTNIFLQEIIEEVNSRANQLYTIKQKQEEVYPNSIYLIPEYDVDKNMINLTNLKNSMRVSRSTVALPNDSNYYNQTTDISFGRPEYWAHVGNTYIESIM